MPLAASQKSVAVYISALWGLIVLWVACCEKVRHARTDNLASFCASIHSPVRSPLELSLGLAL